MLFTLGLLLLLAPFPSFQTTTAPNSALSLLKPKTTPAPAKQTVRPTLRPNTGNQTLSPTPASNQKAPTVNATGTTKSKAGPAVTQATPAVASGSITTKAKHSVTVNQTLTGTSAANQRTPTVNATSNTKSKASPNVSASGTITTKGKQPVTVNQTASAKSAPAVKVSKDKPAPGGTSSVQSASTKTVSPSNTKPTKDKLQPSANQTVSVKSASTSDGKKDRTPSSSVQATPAKSSPVNDTKTTKNKPTASVNQTAVAKPSSTSKFSKDSPPLSPAQAAAAAASAAAADREKAAASNDRTAAANATREKSAAPSQPLKVVINGCDSTNAREQELKLKPGAPLVMTHKISLMPGGCDGNCETEMASLKGRVARLEKEMSLLKNNCPCSAKCPNDCSDNGICEKGKCICYQGFTGPDCSKCAPGINCNKKITKGKVEAGSLLKKDQQKDTDTKESESRTRVTTTIKTQGKQDAPLKKIITKVSSTATKPSRPTVAQVLLKHEGRKQEEVRKGKTVLPSKKVQQKPDQTAQASKRVVQKGDGKMYPKSDQLKDEPQTNVTQGSIRTINVTANVVTIRTKVAGTNKTRTGKGSLEQSTLAEKNGTQTTGHKQIKTTKVETMSNQSGDNRVTDSARGKVAQRSQYIVNATVAATADNSRPTQDKTGSQGSAMSRRFSGTGLGSVKVVNISSYSFTLTWSAPQGMFKNFTVIRREPRADGEEEDMEEIEEETLSLHKASSAKNPAEVQVLTESTDTTAFSGKVTGSRGKAETRRVSMVVPGNVRSVEFSNLRANARYILYMYAAGAERRSKIHRVAVVTGPEPCTEMVFSNVTESSLSVAWSKPKTTFSGFRVTYTNIITGESRFQVLDSQQSYVVLSKLSAGTSYIISVTATHGRVQSDALLSLISTVPAPPTHLQVVNVTDTRATLQWVPSLGKVDRFIVSYESSKTPNVTVTVMLTGNAVEHQLRGLQRGTLYTIKVLSQKDSLQSMAIATTFTTANVVKASEVAARSAVISWRTFTVVYHSYRVIYQVVGEESKEVILDSTYTEYKLTSLLPMSRYTVVVQGERDGHYTSLVTTEFITGKLRFPFPTECSQELLNGALQSGEVDIYPQGKEGQAVRVYCDMETDGGGWTVFQRRMNGKTDFYRSWTDYRAGFGNLSEDFWIGNELLHNLTSVGPVSLRVDLQSGNDTAYAHYANFSVDSEEMNFALMVSGYTGTAGDSMRYHNGRPFSTWDKDTDPLGIHCARAYMGGWWYKNCYKTNLNGLYGIHSNNQGVVWIDWKGKDSSIPFTEMKIRPARFSPATHG